MKLEIEIPSILYQDAKENRGYISVGKMEIAWKAIADGKPIEQEPTTKNDFGVDCISRAEAIKCLECDFDITGKENMKTVVNYINSAHDKIVNLPSVTPQEPVKKLEEQIKQLQNRCHAFTHGQICVFCLYECEHKAESEVEE